MKRIFSTIFVALMIASCFTMTSFAAELDFSINEETSSFDASSRVLTVNVDLVNAAELELWAIEIVFDTDLEFNADGMAETVAFLDTFKIGTESTDDTSSTSLKKIAVLSDANYKIPAGGITVPVKFDVPEGVSEASLALVDGDTFVLGASEDPTCAVDTTIKTIVTATEEAKEVAMTAAPFISAVGHTEDTVAGWQAGQAVVLQFNPADLDDFAAMAWRIKCDGKANYLYAPVKASDFATLKACSVNTDVFASFVINESAETKETLYEIEEVTAEFGKTGETEPWVAVWSN